MNDLVRAALSTGVLRAVPSDVERWTREAVQNPPRGLEHHPVLVRMAAAARLPPSKTVATFDATDALAVDPTSTLAGQLRWVSTAERWQTFAALKRLLPTGITGVAGIARSGLSSAVELAMEWHLQPYSLYFDRMDAITGGWRCKLPPKDDGILLVLDDTIASGQSMERLRPAIEKLRNTRDVLTAAIFVSPEARHVVDVCGAVLPSPHLLEWNFPNSIHAENVALDFDGVLCDDCPLGEDDDGPKYLEFLRTAPLRWAFRLYEIPLVVTARLEKYRAETIRWLESHRMKVRNLVMGPWQDNGERARCFDAGYKGDAYRASGCSLFVESCPFQSRDIHERTGLPVLCASTGEVHQTSSGLSE